MYGLNLWLENDGVNGCSFEYAQVISLRNKTFVVCFKLNSINSSNQVIKC